MPIKTENRHLYPANWKEISKQIRTIRAKNRCENCGIKNYIIVKTLPDGFRRTPSPQEWEMIKSRVKNSHSSFSESLKYHNFTKIVLTVAHLDQNPQNNSPENLKALCQKCHLNHDRKHHQASRKQTIQKAKTVGNYTLNFILALILLLSVTIATAQNPESRIQYPVSFLITIKTSKKTAVFKHATTATADSLTLIYTGKTTALLLVNSPFYETRNKTTWFYIEQKHSRRPKSQKSLLSQNFNK